MASDRLGFGFGLERHGDPAEFDALFSIEYEHRFLPVVGAGIMAEYLFSNPSETRFALPVFLHPLADDWVIFGAPLVLIRSGSAHAGARAGTRVPIPLGVFTLSPLLAVDFVENRQDLFLGLGIGF